MKSARNRKRKSTFLKKIKSFFIYSFISLVVLGFFLNTFVSNILEYSFALANSGGIVDLKSDEKYSVILISTNKLKEVKKISLITYDKKNNKLYSFNLNKDLVLTYQGSEVILSDLLYQNSDSKHLNEVFKSNFATNIAFTHLTSSDSHFLVEKILLGNGSILDLYEARNIEGVSLRDLYFIYSFSGSVDSQKKKETSIKSINELDKELRDVYIDSEIGILSPSITIINSSQVNGLGRKYTRIVTNLGGRVVDTTTGDEFIPESFIIYKEKNSYNESISSKLGITKSLSMEEVGLKYPEIVKSDLVIVLGIDKARE